MEKNYSKQIKLTPCTGKVNSGLIKVKDLNLICIHPLNRMIDPNHVNDFYNIIKKEGDREVILSGSELIVNEVTMTLLDGNHKHPAILRAYRDGIISGDSYVRVLFEHYNNRHDEVTRIIELNIHSKNWQIDDYIDSFAKWEIERGEFNGPYNKLKNFCLEHTLCVCKGKPKYSYGVSMLKGDRRSKDIKNMTFELSDEELEYGHIVHQELSRLKERMGLRDSGKYIESMAKKWWVYRKDIDLKQFLKRKPSDTVTRMPKDNDNDWREVFSRIEYEQRVGSRRA